MFASAGTRRGRPGRSEPHPDSEVSERAPERSRALAGGWDVGEREGCFCISIGNMQDSRWKQGRQNQAGLGNRGWPGLGDRHLVPTALPKHFLLLAFNKHAHSRGEQQIKTCQVLAVQAGRRWIIRAFKREGREGKVERQADHTGRHAQSRAAICRDFACRSGN